MKKIIMFMFLVCSCAPIMNLMTPARGPYRYPDITVNIRNYMIDTSADSIGVDYTYVFEYDINDDGKGDIYFFHQVYYVEFNRINRELYPYKIEFYNKKGVKFATQYDWNLDRRVDYITGKGSLYMRKLNNMLNKIENK